MSKREASKGEREGRWVSEYEGERERALQKIVRGLRHVHSVFDFGLVHEEGVENGHIIRQHGDLYFMIVLRGEGEREGGRRGVRKRGRCEG